MKPIKNRVSFLSLILLVVLVFQSCYSKHDIFIVLGENASKTEKITANHLLSDLNKVSNKHICIVTEKDDFTDADQLFLIGTPSSCSIISQLEKEQRIILSEEFPGSRGGVWANTNLVKGVPTCILAGSDVQGMQYAVYDYCEEVLGIDPFEYWTGNVPEVNSTTDLFKCKNKVIPPPEIPILCYFENDVDELANIKKPMLEYDWENYTQMINSLVRLKYNAIQLFDMLGRPEFFLRPEYKEIRSDYDVRISYVDSMINYAHDMGMMVQIDLALGYKIKPMEQSKADCWSNYKQEWIDHWLYYFEKTPLGKADIFALRPRNQVWDWEYKSSCGEDKITVFNEVYAELGNIIDDYKPEATKVVLCYHDGMEMFNNGFNPPEDWIIAWSDDGWCGFDYWPEDTKGYDFGTYMHAGFWLNHTVHDPCPDKIDTIMKKMVNKYGANKYCMVNGQQFRPFLLNIEAFSKVADNVNAFDGEAFYLEWANDNFGDSAAIYAVNSMKKLHKAQFNKVGYVQHLWEIKEALSYLSNSPIERPGKKPVAYEYGRVENDFEHVEKRLRLLNLALNEVDNGSELVRKNKTFYNDYIQLPLILYIDLLNFETILHEISKNKYQFEKTGDDVYLENAISHVKSAKNALHVLYENRMKGDENKHWSGWYNPANRRPNNGFPTNAMLNQVEENLKGMK